MSLPACPRSKPEREAGDPPHGRLLDDRYDLRSSCAQMRGHREQQRTCARHNDALSANVEARLHEGLQPARAVHAGKRPAGKGQKALARARGQDERGVFDIGELPGLLDAQYARGRRGHCPPAESRFDTRRFETAQQARGLRILLVDAAAPDLAAGGGIVIHKADAHARLGCRGCGDQATGPGAHHEHIDARRSFGDDLHSRAANNLAGPLLGQPVHLGAAFIANAHPAERLPRLAAHRCAAFRSGLQDDCGNRGSRGYRDRPSVQRDG